MEITLAKYNEIMEKLEANVSYYERMNFFNNKFTLYLASGDVLNVRIFQNNIAHLLGINLDYLKLSNRFKPNMKSYDCLKYFMENSYSFSKLVSEKSLSFNQMFSENIDKKLESFIYNINIRTDDIYCIIKYDNEKTYKLEDIPDPCDYYLIRKKLDNYYILGLIENGNYYFPVTSRKYDNYQDFDKFIKRIAIKQEITYPYLMRLENADQQYKSSFILNLDDKEIMLDKIIKLSQKYDATASVSKDFAFVLNKTKNNKINTSTNISILKLLSDSIKSGNVLDNNTIDEICGNVEINEDIINLISVCNNLVCRGEITNDLAIDSYSKLSEENQNLRSTLDELKKELIKEQQIKENLEENNKQLMEQNNNYNEQLQIYEEAYQKVVSIRRN